LIIWKELASFELPQPTDAVWKKVVKEFYSVWQFPNCIGAIARKHIEIQALYNSGVIIFKITLH
jgi:hypothetical protein